MGYWEGVIFYNKNIGFNTVFWNRDDAKKAEADDEERKEDFSALKDALSGLKLGGSIGGAKPQPKDESLDTKIPADTPLNTQIV